jgi:hypothetical protein
VAQYLSSITTVSGIITGGVFQPITSADLPAIPFPGLTDPNADRIPFWDDSAGAIAWLTAGSGLSITGTTLSATGGGLSDGDYGDVSVSGTGTVLTIDNGAVTPAKMSNGAAFSVLGRATSPAGVRADIVADNGSMDPSILVFDSVDELRFLDSPAAASWVPFYDAGPGAWQAAGCGVVPQWVGVPANDGDTGTPGQMSYDSSYLYVCWGANKWGRLAFDTSSW